MQTRKYIIIWAALVALDVLVLGFGPLANIRSLNAHKIVVTGHVAGMFNGVIHSRAPYVYVYNGVTYAGRGRAFAPNMPAQYLTQGQAVEVTLNSDNPSQSVLGDSRVALAAMRRLLVVTALFFPPVGVLVFYLWDRRNKNTAGPEQVLVPQF